MRNLDECRLCPGECGVNRNKGERGFCGAGSKIRVGRIDLHYWEEPCISGERGSGAVFFSGCTMRCDYCQNRELSRDGKGFEIGEDELAERLLELESKGAANINLVTPSHYAPLIVKVLDKARARGLSLPIVYNCGGYEKVETLKGLEGYVDIYLPDLKYRSNIYGVKYSRAADYFNTAAAAIAEMFRQTGPCKFGEDGMMKRGVIIRHLLLPGLLFEAKKIVDYVHETYGDSVWLSLMNQYTVMPEVSCPELCRSVPKGHYEALVNYCAELGMEKVYIQGGDAAASDYIPEFYGE